MAEIAAPAPVITDTSSSSTSDIATKVIADADAADTATADDAADVPADTGVVADTMTDEGAPAVEDAEVKVETPVVPEQTEADKLLSEAGFKAKRADGRENRIPHSSVRKIIDNQLAKERAAFVPDAATTEKITKYEARIAEVDNINDIMSNDQERFLGMLRQLPGYAELLDRKEPEAAPAAITTTNDPMPEPDRQFSNGELTYSHEQHQKLLDWRDRQTEARTEARLMKRFDPLLKDYETDQLMRQNAPAAQRKMAEAKTWDGFEENIEEIWGIYRGNKELTLEAAYQKVVYPKLKVKLDSVETQVKEARAAARAEAIAELKAAPKSTAVQAMTTSDTTPKGPRSTAQIAADVIRNAR